MWNRWACSRIPSGLRAVRSVVYPYERGQWTRNVDFANGEYKQETLIISGLTLTDQTRLRFRNYASATNDKVFIDEVRVSIR